EPALITKPHPFAGNCVATCQRFVRNASRFDHLHRWPERVEDGSCGHKRDFALLQPLDERLNVFPILTSLLKVIENTSAGFIDLAQDETRVAGWGRVGIRRVRELRTLGHVVAQRIPSLVLRWRLFISVALCCLVSLLPS